MEETIEAEVRPEVRVNVRLVSLAAACALAATIVSGCSDPGKDRDPAAGIPKLDQRARAPFPETACKPPTAAGAVAPRCVIAFGRAVGAVAVPPEGSPALVSLIHSATGSFALPALDAATAFEPLPAEQEARAALASAARDAAVLAVGSGLTGYALSTGKVTGRADGPGGTINDLAWTADGATRLAGLRSADGAVDLLAFGLEAVNGDPAWSAGLGEVLERLLDGQSALDPGSRPTGLQLVRCWPNPFNPRLNLRLEGGTPRRLAVFNLAGQRVADLGELDPGRTTAWSPGPLAAGVYVMRTVDGGPPLTERVLWLP